MENEITIQKENVLQAYKQATAEQKEREERVKELTRRITNALLECDDFTYDDIACSIASIVCVVDRQSEKENNTKSGSFAKVVCDMLGSVHKVHSDQPSWIPSTEHPQMDEEVIALVGEYNQIYFAHIVDKRFCVDYDGWNIPDVRWWIPCPKIEEDKL